jgi:UDP-2,3-diacylglucosamine hydrolase
MSNKDAIFCFSDLHFGSEVRSFHKEEKLKRLRVFFDHVKKEGFALYMLGDIFDFWIEYRHSIFSEHFQLLSMISDLCQSGVEVHFLPGNHDYWGGDFLRGLGVIVHADDFEKEHFGKKIYFSHGDGYARSDWKYRNILKPVLRSKVNIFFFKMLHPDIAFSLGRFVSGKDRGPKRSLEEPFIKETEEKVRFILNKGYDIHVMGHTHLGRIKPVGNGLLCDCGNFFEDYSFIKIDPKNVTICDVKEYTISSQTAIAI